MVRFRRNMLQKKLRFIVNVLRSKIQQKLQEEYRRVQEKQLQAARGKDECQQVQENGTRKSTKNCTGK